MSFSVIVRLSAAKAKTAARSGTTKASARSGRCIFQLLRGKQLYSTSVNARSKSADDPRITFSVFKSRLNGHSSCRRSKQPEEYGKRQRQHSTRVSFFQAKEWSGAL